MRRSYRRMPTETTAKARTGDSIEAVFRQDSERLWRSLLLSTANAEVASDAVAEAFAQAIRRGPRLRDAQAWIWRTAFRLAAAEMKRWRETIELTDSLSALDTTLVEVMEALRRLTKHQRTAVVLADYAGYSHREIANVLGSSTSAVAVHVYRGRRRLRALLEVHDD